MIATDLDYLPHDPVSYSPGIGIIGCGNISAMHLAAYRAAGYRVVVLCDTDLEKARERRDEFFPEAEITDDHHVLLGRQDVEVVDIATHVDVRPALIRDAIAAGKHVLSQKPFVSDLDEGEELARLADERGVVLAVNQNGRWAPHFAALLAAERSGVFGRISTADFALYWPHDIEVADHPVFSRMEHLILYDFGIHWFDIVANLFSRHAPATSVYATLQRTAGQVIPVPTSAQVMITFPDASATLLLRGSSHRARSGSYRVDGSAATLLHASENELGGREVLLSTDEGVTSLDVEGTWWANGMHGTMAELLSAVEGGRRPSNEARRSLPGLALCFAAMQSARTGVPVDPRRIRRLPS
jgi:predicted dehydrogenase